MALFLSVQKQGLTILGWFYDQFANHLPTYLRSKRSNSITLVHAATKSHRNLSWLSSQAYTSARARNSELDPKMRSTLEAVHLSAAVFLSLPMKRSSSSDAASHLVLRSKRFTKKSLLKAPLFFVNTPWALPS